jgi:multidrug efflux system outer membrane protein
MDFSAASPASRTQALAQYLATEEARKAAQISLVAAVASTWLNLQADDELLAITQRTLATREESLRLTKLRLDNGASSALDMRQAESLTAGARATLQQQQRLRAQDLNALTLLVGQPLPEPAALRRRCAGHVAQAQAAVRPAVCPPPTVPAGLPSDLLLRRPDIRQAEQQLIAANANIGAARAASSRASR